MTQDDSMSLSDGDLLAYIDGVASAKVVATIESSTQLQAEVDDMRNWLSIFHTGLYRNACPPVDDLLLFEAGLHPTATQQAIERHVMNCLHCQAELSALGAVSVAEAASRAPRLPEFIARLRDAGRQILTGLEIPAAMQKPALARGRRRHRIAFEAGPYSIVMLAHRPTFSFETWTVVGRIKRTAEARHYLEGGNATLYQEERLVDTDVVDGLGHWQFNHLPVGHYALHLEVKDDIVHLPSFELPERGWWETEDFKWDSLL